MLKIHYRVSPIKTACGKMQSNASTKTIENVTCPSCKATLRTMKKSNNPAPEQKTIALLLADLNELLVGNGKQPAKSWKKSKADLIQTITIEQHTADERKQKTIQVPKEMPENCVTVVKIATDLGVNPKVARRRLRENRSALPDTAVKNRWVFSIDVVDQVKIVITGKASNNTTDGEKPTLSTVIINKN